MIERRQLKSLYVSGFKSFAWSPHEIHQNGQVVPNHHGKRVALGDVTVFLGANGSGKSNVVSLCRLLRSIAEGNLQNFVGVHGGAGSLFHYGPKATPHIEVKLELAQANDLTNYTIRLSPAQPDTVVVTDEAGAHSSPDGVVIAPGFSAGDLEARLSDAKPAAVSGQVVAELLRNLQTFQFDDTSTTAAIRRGGYIEDARQLHADGGNLAAVLLGLRLEHRPHYDRIRNTVRQACPQFDDFVLGASVRDPNTILLNWRSQGHGDYLMGPHQLSDGTLRFMALTTLLLQPQSMLPWVIVIDEPELGLHPQAIGLLAAMVHEAATHSQVVLATQSPTLVDHFDLTQLRPIAHTGGQSTFLELDVDDLRRWLDDYSLGEMWQKNLLRGGPEHA